MRAEALALLPTTPRRIDDIVQAHRDLEANAVGGKAVVILD